MQEIWVNLGSLTIAFIVIYIALALAFNAFRNLKFGILLFLAIIIPNLIATSLAVCFSLDQGWGFHAIRYAVMGAFIGIVIGRALKNENKPI